MYENGAERWGPGACDRCPDLEAYEELEENSRYKARRGTNEAEGWTKTESIKWVWIYDKNFQTDPPEEEGDQHGRQAAPGGLRTRGKENGAGR